MIFSRAPIFPITVSARINDSLKLRLQNAFVVIASYVFYGWWDWRFLILIAFTSFCSWGSGLLIDKSKIINLKSKMPKFWLWLNIAINLGILAIFKYYDFFVSEFGALFGINTDSLLLRIILPVGISFYTFQALSYSIDVYRGDIKPTKDIIAFFAYVAFFPQLVAGPIERATNLLPQFEKARTFDYQEAVDGCRRILWGLFKKMVVADNCATYVNRIWDDYSNQPGSALALAAILFAFQIYGDFSGYSDIAIGTSRLFGIRLRENFITPYFSRSVAEFWKRWHISLNTWFVDYVYIPLGGSRNGQWNTIRNTFVIFLLSGLWHGAHWTYVTWGLYHALLFVPLILMHRTKKYRDMATLRQIPQILLTFGLIVLGWIIFRAPSIGDAWGYIQGMCQVGTLRALYRFFLPTDLWVYPMNIYIVIMLMVEWRQRNRMHGLEGIELLPILKHKAVRIVLYALCLTLIIFLRGGYEKFIYFQF